MTYFLPIFYSGAKFKCTSLKLLIKKKTGKYTSVLLLKGDFA